MQPIHITLIRSNLLMGLLIAVSTTSCLILLALPFALIIKLVAIMVILASSAYYTARDALLVLPASLQMLDVNAKGELTVTNNRGETFQPKLAPSSFYHTKMVILNFQREGFNLAMPSLILVENQQLDSKVADEIRRLRVYLRWFNQQKIK